MLAKRGRLKLALDASLWVQKVLQTEFFEFVPVDNDIATLSARLPESDFPKDPADRMIIATALSLGLPLVSKDQSIRDCTEIEAIWD